MKTTTNTMKLTKTTNTIESNYKKEWKSPEIAELPIDQTSQLDPPSVDDPQGS